MKIKLVKKILLLFLIFCINIVYATGYGTESGSFVSKEEFDVTLKNFNDRLTVFEGGINSKIDTQVTSYLDRNGIWSREPQVVVTTEYDMPTTNTLASRPVIDVNFEKSTAVKKMFTSTKSGLAFCRVYYYTTKGNTADSWWGWAFYPNANKVVTDDYMVVSFDFYEGISTTVANNKLLTSWVIGSVSDTANQRSGGQWGNQICLMIALPSEKVYNNIMFFVEKDKDYGFRFYARGKVTNCAYKDARTHGGKYAVEAVDVY